MKPNPCPCNRRQPIDAYEKARNGIVVVCPECSAKTPPMNTKGSAIRVWNAMTSEAGKGFLEG